MKKPNSSMQLPAGYSGTPLIKKLGIKPGMRVRFINEPSHYLDLLGPLPEDVVIAKATKAPLDFIHFFTQSASELDRLLPRLKAALAMNGTLWISWPKRSSSLKTKVGEADIREAGLEVGLVDVKICAVDANWSGLKFVYRLKDRS